MSTGRIDRRRSMTLQEAIDRMFGESEFGRLLFSGRSGFSEDQWVPVNMFELPEGLMIVVPMPGLQPEDVELTVTDTTLTLHGRRSPGQEDREYLLKEWDYGPYRRVIDLPYSIDTEHIIATLDNGVLTVNLRMSSEIMPKKIHIRSASQRSLVGGETHESEQGHQREKASGIQGS